MLDYEKLSLLIHVPASPFRKEKIIKCFKPSESPMIKWPNEKWRDVEPPVMLMMFRVIIIFSPNVLSPTFTL